VTVHGIAERRLRPRQQGGDRSVGPGSPRGLGRRDRRAHRPPLPLRSPEEGFVVLDVLAIVALQQTEPDDFSWIIPQDLPDRHEVTEALRHLSRSTVWTPCFIR